MKKIILESQGREINISTLQEVDTVQDIFTELIIPAFQASGFTPETINDGLSEYMEFHMPTIACKNCGDIKGLNETLNEEFKKLEKNYQIVYNQNEDYGRRIDNHVIKETKMAEQIVGLQNGEVVEPAAEELRKEIDFQKGQVEHFKRDNRKLIEDITELNTRLDEYEDIETPVEQPTEKKYRCENCAEEFIIGDLDPKFCLCKACYDSEICPDCENLNDECLCEIYEPTKPVVQTPRVPEPNVWNTGTVRDGWTTAPAEQATPEPEQATPEPETGGSMKCPHWGECERVCDGKDDLEVCSKDNWSYFYTNKVAPEETQEDIPEPLVCPRKENCKRDGDTCTNQKDIETCGKVVWGYFIAKGREKTHRPEPEKTCEKCGLFRDRDSECSGDNREVCGYWEQIEGTPEPQDEQETAPLPEAVGIWNTDELQKECAVTVCPICKGEIISRGDVFLCKECNYRNDCECHECEEKREKAGIPKLKSPPPEPTETVELTDEVKAENLKKSLDQQEEIEKILSKGDYYPNNYDGNQIGCGNTKNFFPHVSCDDKCTKCPVGRKDRQCAMEHGLFYCPGCGRFFDKPFPVGYCPQCGVHGSSRGDEYCRKHWDINRPCDNFTADEEENWMEDKDGNQIGSYKDED